MFFPKISVFRFGKPRTDEAKPLANSSQMRVNRRLALLLGTAAIVYCPVAMADDLSEAGSAPENYPKAFLPAIYSHRGAKKPHPAFNSLNTFDLNPGETVLSNFPQTKDKQKPFYTLDTPAPPLVSQRTDAPSRMDSFNKNLSRVVTIEMNATFEGRSIGTIPVETTLSKVIAVEATSLQKILGPLLDDSTQLLLTQFKSGFVSVERLRAIDVDVRLNPATLTLDIEAPSKPSSPLKLSLAGRDTPEGAETASPANFAAGLTSTFLINENFGDDGDPALSSALSGFVNFGGIRGLNLDYGGIVTIDDGNGASRFDADRTVLFFDRPERALRFQAGTLYTPLSDIVGDSDYLGIGLTKSYQQLQPTRVVRPLGQRAFQLSRPSEVTVLVDGQVISRFEAKAGEVNLSDIPLANISNRVTIVVEDEFGRRETESFSIASDALLLSPGLSEYSFGLGRQRDRDASGFSYTDETIATGSFQFGVSPSFTLGAFAHYSEDLSIFGSQSVSGVFNGLAQFELAYSDSASLGGGMAASANYRWNGSPSSQRSQSFAFSLNYRDETFTTDGSQFGTTTKFDASAFYERQLSDNLRINIAGSYTDDYLTDTASTTVSIGSSYQLGNYFLGAGARLGSAAGRDDEVGAFFTLTRRLGKRSSVNARYDTQNDRSSLRYRRPSRDEIGSFRFQSELSRRDKDLTLSGAADYTANRYRSRLSLIQGSQDAQLDGTTSLAARIQTGIAFADGKLGIGRDPGRGFVMVDRHKSLSDARVEIRSRGRQGVKARSGILGPAIAALNSPYVPTTTHIDIDNAPVGYNVGQGSYYSTPGARSGVKITVGNDAYRSVVATFFAEGEPLSLAVGTLTNVDIDVSQVTFTNSSGRALLSNLSPGAYQLVFSGTDYSFNFKIDKDSEAFSNLGKIDLTMGNSQ